MKIGIIGTTPHAQSIGRQLASAGNEVSYSDPASPQRSQTTAYQQTIASDILILAMPWDQLDRAIAQMGRPGAGVVVAAVRADGPVRGSAAQHIALLLESRSVVEAFLDTPSPGSTVPVCGDDPESKKIVMEMIAAAGWRAEDRGAMVSAHELESRSQAA